MYNTSDYDFNGKGTIDQFLTAVKQVCLTEIAEDKITFNTKDMRELCSQLEPYVDILMHLIKISSAEKSNINIILILMRYLGRFNTDKCTLSSYEFRELLSQHKSTFVYDEKVTDET